MQENKPGTTTNTVPGTSSSTIKKKNVPSMKKSYLACSPRSSAGYFEKHGSLV
jgi:hypothetical protein